MDCEFCKKTFSSKSFVWAPTHKFSLLRKLYSVVRFPDASKAVYSLRVTANKGTLDKCSFLLR